MYSKVVYRDAITGAARTETARVIKVDAEAVTLRAANGLKYTRPLDLVETIDGKPAA